MNNRLTVMSFLIVINQILCSEKPLLMPNLPVGPFKMRFVSASICNSSIDYPLKFDYYTSKITQTKVLAKGNLTFKIHFDDKLYFNLNMAVWSKIGGWKDNAIVYKNKGACSTLKFFLGNTWNEFKSKHHFSDCPIKPGFYIVDGFDLETVAKANIHKQFFYGTYKTYLFYTNEKNENVGCCYVIIEMLRPWE